MSTISSFSSIEKKHGVYRGKDCMKNLLIKEQQESHENAKICYICKEKFENIWKIKNIVKVNIIAIIQGSREMLRIVYVIQNVVCLITLSIVFIMDQTMIIILS